MIAEMRDAYRLIRGRGLARQVDAEP
jgi:hypothetical protein